MLVLTPTFALKPRSKVTKLTCSHLKHINAHRGVRRHSLIQASSSEGSGAADPDPIPPPASSSSSSSSSPQAYAIPTGIPSAGAVFVLAGFLKLLIMCFPFSTMAISMYLQGRADLGIWAVTKMLPIALGILALAKYLVDNKELLSRKWFHRAVAVGGVCALLLSRWLFARPRPSPLDPLIRATQEARIAQMAALQQRQEAARQGSDRTGLKQGGEEVRKELQRRSRRFE